MKSKLAILMTMSMIALGALAQTEKKASTGEAIPQPTTAMKSPQAGAFFTPETSRARAGHAHTNYVLRSRDGSKPAASMDAVDDEAVFGPDGTVEKVETPCSLGYLYVGSPSTPCTPSFTSTGGPSSAGYGIIALVDAFDNPNAASDLSTFSSHFGLPAATFRKVYATGNGSCTKVPADAGWALEESLDIEWAHVFAPKAEIVLVEACSNSYADLFYAEQTAFEYIVNHAVSGQVSNSWSGGELDASDQIADDPIFQDTTYVANLGYKYHVTAFASAGDDGVGAGYPSTNPWVISAGGTTVQRSSSTGAVTGEACWSGSGGGTSAVETWADSYTGGNMGPWAAYQYPIFGQSARSTPDLSFDADPASGVYVLSQFNGGWYSVGGTSVSSPALASIVNRAGNNIGSVDLHALTGNNGFFTAGENNLLYSNLPAAADYALNFYDVKTGSNGTNAVAGYDQCTGVGSPRGLHGK